jgi:hypothetical protein
MALKGKYWNTRKLPKDIGIQQAIDNNLCSKLL